MALLPFGSPPGQKPLGTAANPFPASGYYMTDGTGVQWVVTVDSTGHLVTTKLLTGTTGTPYGLLLSLTQP